MQCNERNIPRKPQSTLIIFELTLDGCGKQSHPKAHELLLQSASMVVLLAN